MRPPKRQVVGVVEVVAKWRRRVRGDLGSAIHEDAMTLSHNAWTFCRRHFNENLRRTVTLRRGEVGSNGGAFASMVEFAVVEEQFENIERGFANDELVFGVSAAPRCRVYALVTKRRHVERAQIETHPSSDDEFGIVGDIDQSEKCRDVEVHVDVAVPLEEPETGAFVDPIEHGLLRTLGVFGTCKPGDRELPRGHPDACEVLIDEPDHEMIL